MIVNYHGDAVKCHYSHLILAVATDPEGNSLPYERSADVSEDLVVTYTPRQVGK